MPGRRLISVEFGFFTTKQKVFLYLAILSKLPKPLMNHCIVIFIEQYYHIKYRLISTEIGTQLLWKMYEECMHYGNSDDFWGLSSSLIKTPLGVENLWSTLYTDYERRWKFQTWNSVRAHLIFLRNIRVIVSQLWNWPRVRLKIHKEQMSAVAEKS